MGTKEVMTDCTLCYHSCGVKVTVEDGRAVKVAGLKEHPLTNGKLCPKGGTMLENIYSLERIKYPMKRTGDTWERISWEQALDEISARLLDLKAKYGPEVLGVFCGSIGVENLEMNGLTQRFRSAFGSSNFFSVESVCFRMRLHTRQLTFGKVLTEEYDSNLYILWGHNPDSSDLPLKIHMAENRVKGAKMVVIDPKRTTLADGADMYLRIRPGTDGALALAMINVIVTENLYAKEFIDEYTFGFEKLVPHIQQYTPEWAEKITGVNTDDIRKLARLFAGTRGASIFQGTCSLDQTANGTQTSRAISILQTITGNINVPGGWVSSPRPSLGSVAMAVDSETPLGSDKYPVFFQMLGRKSNYGVVTLLPENIPQRIKAFVVVGGNPLVSMADSNAFREAFKKLDLLVVHDLFMTETAKAADYVLPACSHLEKWGVAYTYNVNHCLPYLMLRKKAIEPLGESWSEWRLFTELAGKLGLNASFPWKSEEEMVAFELEPSGLCFGHLLNEKPEGAYYRQKKYCMEKPFRTSTGKIEIYSCELAKVGADPLPTYTEPHRSPVSTPELLGEYPLILCTGARSLFYTHSQFRHVASLRKNNPEPLAELACGTASKYDVKTGDMIIIRTPSGRGKMKATISDRVAEGVVLVPHGWSGEANANLLTDTNSRESVMGYPEMKALLCSVRKVCER
jgi:anaerobic selenocysteine-containing dehydrogenase